MFQETEIQGQKGCSSTFLCKSQSELGTVLRLLAVSCSGMERH